MDRKTRRQKPLEEINETDIFSELVRELTAIPKQPGEFTADELVERTGRKLNTIKRVLNGKVRDGRLSKRKIRDSKITRVFYKFIT